MLFKQGLLYLSTMQKTVLSVYRENLRFRKGELPNVSCFT